MAAKPPSALAKFIKSIKDEGKAQRDISSFLKSIIEEHSASEEFDRYIDRHAHDAGQYLERFNDRPRQGMFRASSAGKCMQQQAFKALKDAVAVIPIIIAEDGSPGQIEVTKNDVARKGRQYRALFNGTYGHVRWHMFFDFLEEKGVVKTLFKEELRYNEEFQVSGTCDRVIQIVFQEQTFVIVVDFKTIKKEYFDKLVEPEAQHKDQQQVYGMFDFGATRWMMLYENKNDQDVQLYDRSYDHDRTMSLKQDYRTMIKWVEDVKAGIVPQPLPVETRFCNFCEFNKLCLKINPNR